MRRVRTTALIIALSALAARFASAGVAFSALEDGTWAVYWQDGLDATPELVLRSEDSDLSAPRVAGEGAAVAVQKGHHTVAVMNRDASQAWTESFRIQDGVRPAWRGTPGDWVFVRYKMVAGGEDSDLYFCGPDGAERVLVGHTGNQDYPHLSPDGTKLAYTSTQIVGVFQAAVTPFQQIWTVDLSRGRVRPLWIDATENIEPAWSPSGEQIAFASNKSGRFEIWSIDSDGSHLRQITSGRGAKTRPAWSPNGDALLYTSMIDGRYGLWIVAADGSAPRPYQPFASHPDRQTRDADWK